MDAETVSTYSAESSLRTIFENARMSGQTSFTAFGSSWFIPHERMFADVASVEMYVNRVCQLAQVRIAYPTAINPPTVRAKIQQTSAHYDALSREIVLPIHVPGSGTNGWAMRELVVLHELAHHLTPFAQHNTEYRRAYVFLLGECVSPTIAMLQAAFYDMNNLSLISNPKGLLSSTGTV